MVIWGMGDISGPMNPIQNRSRGLRDTILIYLRIDYGTIQAIGKGVYFCAKYDKYMLISPKYSHVLLILQKLCTQIQSTQMMRKVT